MGHHVLQELPLQKVPTSCHEVKLQAFSRSIAPPVDVEAMACAPAK